MIFIVDLKKAQKESRDLKQEVDFLKEALDYVEDILDEISSESNPSHLDRLTQDYYSWKQKKKLKEANKRVSG